MLFLKRKENICILTISSFELSSENHVLCLTEVGEFFGIIALQLRLKLAGKVKKKQNFLISFILIARETICCTKDI